MPGGTVRQGEELDECVKREVAEETTKEIEVGDILLITETIWPNQSRHIIDFIFSAQSKTAMPVVQKSEWSYFEERLDVPSFIPINELDHITLRPNIKEVISKIYHGEKFQGVYQKNMWCP